ncbi:hypothetical protein GALL_420370 [mine drainage metagenome]|uniref:NAD-specific glutamate dehydrogenase n=1 Tax=mine drainage metagenome TaxID=410659 RepID=A0A1J5Q8E1_9ZZZZ
MHRDADGARLVGDGAGDGLANPPGGVGGKLVAAAIFELVHRLHQADVALLDQIQELQATVGVLLGDGNHQAQIGLDHLSLGAARTRLTRGHLLVDFLEFLDRQSNLGLQIQQALLAVQHIVAMALQFGGIGLARGQFAFEPFQVAFIARKHLDEMRTRHAGFFHAEIHDLALMRTHFFHHGTHVITQRFHLFGGKAEGHQFGQNLVLQHLVALVLGTVLVQYLLLFFEGRTDHGEALEDFFQQLRERRCRNRGGLGAVVVLFFLVLHFRVLGLSRFFGKGFNHGDIGVDQTVHHLIHAQLFPFDLVDHREQLGDGGGAGGDGLHHVLEAVFDALGDFDFAFAGQEVYRAHFAHVHAYRIGGSAEFRIDRGQRLLGLLHGIFVGHGGRRVRHQEGIGIRGNFVHLDAHVVDHADDAVDLLALLDVVRKMVINFGIGQVTALLSEHDQRLEPCAAHIGISICLYFRFLVLLLFSHARPQNRLNGKTLYYI